MAVEPRCPYFGECGGCLYQHFTYEEELEHKLGKLRELFSAHETLERFPIEPVVASPLEYGYRHRLDLTLRRYMNGDLKFGYGDRSGKEIVEVATCPIGMPAVSDFLPQLKQEAVAVLPEKYRTANLTLRTGDNGAVRWGGIGKKSLSLAPEAYFWAELNGKKIHYSMDTFFQANLSILPALEERFQLLLKAHPARLFLDLYGGVGLFSVMAAPLVKEVILVESNAASTAVAIQNLRTLGLENVGLHSGRVEDALPAALAHAPLNECLAMVDPPRAGLSEDARALLDSHLERLVYLSCNPETLVRDLIWFHHKGWQLEQVIPFDFFPKTRHLEVLTMLSRSR